MKLSPDQIKLLSILIALYGADPIWIRLALGEVPNVPTFRAALVSRLDAAISALVGFKGALGAGTAGEQAKAHIAATPGEQTALEKVAT